jgi:hypothetical protein
MPAQYTTNPHKTAPSAADGVSVSPSGVAWTAGSWVTVIASAAADSVLTGIVARSTDNANLEFEVDVAVGAAAAEVVIATFKGRRNGNAFNTDGNGFHMRASIPVDAIASGARVAVRVRVSTTSTTAWNISATYYEKPIVGNLDVSASVLKVVPSAALLATVTSGVTSWVATGWVELIASTSAAIVVDGIITANANNNIDWEVDIGVGAAASEAVVFTFRGRTAGSVSGPGYTPLECPFDGIGAGARVAARVRINSAFAAMQMGLSYREKPL